MLESLSLLTLTTLFALAAAAVWYAGIWLSNTTDIIDTRFGVGEAFGGLVLLAITTNLPEIGIVISASLTHNVSLAIGNILGGIAVQTVVLVLLDGYGLGRQASLTYRAASLQLVLEGILVIVILLIAIMGTQMPKNLITKGIAPGDVLITLAWFFGLWLIYKARKDLPWQEKGRAPDTHRPEKTQIQQLREKWHTPVILGLFILAAAVTFVAGVLLELTGSVIATRLGLSGVVFGATILALITALPEISTGLAAVEIGDYTLAISDIFGGNAFLPVLFLPASLLSKESVLPQAVGIDIYLACLGALLTAVYIYGLIFRPKKQLFCMGIDSIFVLVIYVIGIIGLAAI